MDFMSDELFNGDRIRLFTLVDHFTRESPAIEVARSIPERRAVEVRFCQNSASGQNSIVPH